MAEFDWRKLVGAVAPTLATALGGPLAGAAVSALSTSLLGKPDGTEAEVITAIQTGGAQALAQLKEAENAFIVRMRELDIDVERIHQQDRDSARQRESHTADSWTPRILAACVVGGFLGTVYMVLAGKVQGLTDPVAMGLIGTLIGYASAKADQVISYYFGSSNSSAQKTALLAKR